MPFVASFILLAALGALNAGYLVRQHYAKKPLVCPLNHDCSVVTESRWAHVFGVRNEVLGLGYYLALFIAVLIVIASPESAGTIYPLLFLATIGGLLFSAFLVGIQMVIIKDYCFYCMISALLSLLLFLNSILL